MPTALLERLRAALAPEYEVERELGRGGMGAIFLARDATLDRYVAIKILQPETATALAAERFLREARILASFSHPNLVAVHRAGEADGLYYYSMDYVEEETLKGRLSGGSLAVAEAIKLGDDLLAALEAVHEHGIVHRDIKPSNIFQVGDRALLGDFGIAKHLESTSTALTEPDRRVGTPGYMAPEQAAGGQVTRAADIYAVGMVLYEAITARRWSVATSPTEADWSHVPRAQAQVLKRALAWAPGDRWASAGEFRKALLASTERGKRRRTLALIGGAAAFAIGAFALGQRSGGGGGEASDGPAATNITFVIEALANRGSADSALADSVTTALVASLAGPDFLVVGPEHQHRPDEGIEVLLSGEVAVSGDSVRISARSQSSPLLAAVSEGRRDGWAGLVDELSYDLLLQIWQADSPLESLPRATLPKSSRGLAAFFHAERAFAGARWQEAYKAYSRAAVVDSTCIMCSWRLRDISRWLSIPQDPSRQPYRTYIDSFPPWYQMLIRASYVPMPQQLDTLAEVTRRYPKFYLAWFERGDEIFHRGPLAGIPRHEAERSLRLAVQLRPRFAPAWEHLAFLTIAEGDSVGALEALTRYREASGAGDPLSDVLRALAEAGFAWRFLDPEVAAGLIEAELAKPHMQAFPELAAGPRILGIYFDAARGEVWMGERFAIDPGIGDFRLSGLLAQVFGNLALGRPTMARHAAAQLEELPEEEVEFFRHQLEATLSLLDYHAGEPPALTEVRGGLERYARRGASVRLAARAAWMLTLLARHVGEAEVAQSYRQFLVAEAAPPALHRFVVADAIAVGDLSGALELTDDIRVFDSRLEEPDPFYRTLLHFKRAEWYELLGDFEGARRELRWHENADVAGTPRGGPQSADVDAAFGALGRWRLARLLDGAGETGEELCSAYRDVHRLWSSGEDAFRARADTARTRFSHLGCT